ncbi:MAG: hypothetical protein VXW32_08215 [Myxococcota bacterium]|nr:hypothetical protein [Myxococcota bacterium]
MKAFLPAVSGFFLLACGLQPKNLQSHRVVAANATELPTVVDLRFGVLGNTRTAIPLVDKAGGAHVSLESSGQVIGDLLWQRQQEALDFVVLLGDMVRASRTAEWDAFDAQWRDLVEGSSVSELGGDRVPVVPVAGDRESLLDERLTGFGASFPSFGVDIGFNRVASWGFFDQEIGGASWRFLVVDSNKEALGSRWREQMFWLPKAAAGAYDHLIVFMHDSRVTLATDGEMNPDGVPKELVDAIEEHAGLMKLRAVFSAGSHSSEIYLPEGRLGTAYVGAGGGGARASTLRRWGDGRDAGLEAIQLEPRFDMALQGALVERSTVSDAAISEARAEGEWEGFIGAYNAKAFPLFGYWMVDIEGDTLELSFRLLEETGALKEVYRIRHRPREGWSAP